MKNISRTGVYLQAGLKEPVPHGEVLPVPSQDGEGCQGLEGRGHGDIYQQVFYWEGAPNLCEFKVQKLVQM